MADRTSPDRTSFFSAGRRPADRLFFLGGAAWAALAMALSVGALAGAGGPLNFDAGLGSAMLAGSHGPLHGPVSWHAHEMLFGYVVAVVAGFLLTAVPNWASRPPVAEPVLVALFALWLAGRLALAAGGGTTGATAAAATDSLFLVALGFVILREIVMGRNWRNLKTVGLVAVIAVANAGFHAEAIATGAPDRFLRLGLAAVVGLIAMIGGRIVPRFTRDWLAALGTGPGPAPYGRFDTATLLLTAGALGAWVVAPAAAASGAALGVAGLAHTVRLSRWAGLRTRAEPLLFVLHAAYAFVPMGFLAVGISILRPDVLATGTAVHLWMTGAIGLMTLAVMTRGALGHAGLALVADRATVAIYAGVAAAAILRVLAGMIDAARTELLIAAAAAWILAFCGFLLRYGPLVSRAGRARAANPGAGPGT